MDMDWAPDACTLPTAERPTRVAEFDELFATALVAVDRPTALSARFTLAAGPGIAATVADLVARESQCCAFFTFDLVEGGDALSLTVGVPPGQVDVLDGLTARASAAAGRRSVY